MADVAAVAAIAAVDNATGAGGHDSRKSGEYVRVSRPAFHQRWQVEGPNSGWAIVVND